MYEGEFPTLGHDVIASMSAYPATPDVGEFQPFVPTDDQARFLLRWYAVDEETGTRFLFRRAVYSRLRGGGKSPLVAAVAAAEALADVVPDGFDADGEPVGKPWSSIRTPLVQIAVVSESQTMNAWRPLLEMLTGGPAVDIAGLEPMATFVNLPGRSRIEPITAAALNHLGNPAVAVMLDQTESWTPSNGGVRLHETLITNVGKRGGRTIETPNAYIPARTVSPNGPRSILHGGARRPRATEESCSPTRKARRSLTSPTSERYEPRSSKHRASAHSSGAAGRTPTGSSRKRWTLQCRAGEQALVSEPNHARE
jgi:hypothetical protein